MKKHIGLVLLLVCLVSGVAYGASDISSAKYMTTVTLSNAGTAITNGVAVWDLSTQGLIDADMLSATADDCALLTGEAGTDIIFMPSVNSSYNWVSWVDSIGASASLNQYLYHKDVTGGYIRYFPGSTGMTVPDDDPTLEISDNGSVSFSGYVDTSVSGNITTKEVLKIYSDGIGNVSANVSNDYKTPLWNYDPSFNYVNRQNAYDGNTATYAQNAVGTSAPFYHYASENTTWAGMRFWVSDVLGGAPISTTVYLYYNGTYREVYNQVPPAGEWVYVPFNSVQASWVTDRLYINVIDASAPGVRVYEVEFVKDYSLSTSVTAGEHDIEFDMGNPVAPIINTELLDAGNIVTAGSVNLNANDYWYAYTFKLDSTYTAGGGN